MSNSRLFCVGAVVAGGLAALSILFSVTTDPDRHMLAIRAMLMGGAFAVAIFGDRKSPPPGYIAPEKLK